ncbi:MAG: toll/interleukin-1 receptor domain-containing protein [bacterium]|nr:toll/interleukin-1 receptor domain-containing protein [bacterium]
MLLLLDGLVPRVALRLPWALVSHPVGVPPVGYDPYMPRKYAAFLSYSHRYADWVEVLHANLEACLAHAGEPRQVFLDQVDLGTGHSWVSQLQAGLDQADKLVLVVTPEALASLRVEDEWGTFIAIDRDWKGRLGRPILPRRAPPTTWRSHDRERSRGWQTGLESDRAPTRW